MAVQRKDYIGVFLVAFVASAGGNYGSSFFRADKYTGSQGDVLEQRITRLETELPPTWLTDRIDRLELKIDRLLEALHEHQ